MLLTGTFPLRWTAEGPKTEDLERSFGELAKLATDYPVWFALALAVAVLASVLVLVVRSFAKGSLIYFLRDALASREVVFVSGVREGKKHTWPIALVSLIMFGAVCVSLVVLLGPVLAFALAGRIVQASFLSLVALLILFPILIVTFFVGTYAAFYIVLLGFTVRSAIGAAFELFRRRLLQSIAIGAVVSLVEMAFAFVAFFLLSAVLPFIGKSELITSAVIFAATLLVGAFLAIFQIAVWVQAFLFFVQPIPAPKPVPAEEVAEPDPEPAGG